jgi:hypothetical protein
MGGDQVSPSFMMVFIPLLANRRFGSDCPGNCRCRYTPNNEHSVAAQYRSRWAMRNILHRRKA